MELDEALLQEESGDEELARELEEERQKILAATNHGGSSSSHSQQSRSDHSIQLEDDLYDEDDLDPDDIPDPDDSEDEWQPPEPASRSTRQSKRRRRQSSSQDSDDDAANQELSQQEDEPVTKKSKTIDKKHAKGRKADGVKKKAKTAAADAKAATNGEAGEQEEAYDSFDEEAERVQAEVEAAAAWADVRRRKEAAQAPAPSSSSNPTTNPAPEKQPSSAPSLTAWLGKGPSASSSVSELAASLPMPTTCSAAQITDRSSLFIGYVYPLTTASSAYISALLSHLTRVVHPTVPVSLLPPQFANAPANKRGSSHDMYAYRVFELKRGRTGLAGPDDFSLQEDKEDDGERWGGDRVLRVARDEGSSDVLVIVSRWYGGELLGPVRFDHIENAARAAIQEHMQHVEVDEFRQRLQWLDRKIAQTRAKLQPSGERGDAPVENKYADLTLDRAQRLWLARQKALDALQKRVAQQTTESDPPSQPTQPPSEAVSAEETVSAVNDTEAAPADASTAPGSAAADSADAPAEEATVKAEPAAAAVASPPAVKPEPSSPTLPAPPAGPIRVKDEPGSPAPNLALEHSEEEEDSKAGILKPDPDQDDPDDLTGWDDLS